MPSDKIRGVTKIGELYAGCIVNDFKEMFLRNLLFHKINASTSQTGSLAEHMESVDRKSTGAK